MADENRNIDRLAAAGLVKTDALDAADRAAIGQLTDQEVTQIIELARRLYPNDPAIMKLMSHSSGQARLFFPL